MKPLSLFAALALISCSTAPGPVVPETKVERQMIGLLQKFDLWDYNGDGYLDATELKPAEKLSGHSPERIIAFYDTNRDHRISLREAQSGMSRVDEAQQKAKE